MLIVIRPDGTWDTSFTIKPGNSGTQADGIAWRNNQPLTDNDLRQLFGLGYRYGLIPDAAAQPVMAGTPGYSYAVAAWTFQGFPPYNNDGILSPPSDGQGYPLGYNGPRGIVPMNNAPVGSYTTSAAGIAPPRTYSNTPLPSQQMTTWKGGSPMSNSNTLILDLLAKQPLITALKDSIVVVDDDLHGSAAVITSVLKFSRWLGADLKHFIAVQDYTANLAFDEALVLGNLGQQDVLTVMSIVQQAPAAKMLDADIDAILDTFSDLAILPTADAFAACYNLIQHFGTYAGTIAGIAGAFSGGGTSNLLLIAALGGQNLDPTLGRKLLLEAALLGPACAAFQKECDTAATAVTALGPADTAADIYTALAPWLAALSAFADAMSQSDLFGAIGY